MPAIPGVPLPLTRNPPVEPTTKGHQEPGRPGAHALQEFRRSLTTHECRHMVASACAPRRRWWIRVADHVCRHRRSRDRDAKHRPFAVETRRAPQHMLPTHVSDERARLRGDGRPSWPLPPALPRQVMPHALPRPSSHRLRVHDRKGGDPSRPHRGAQDPEASIGW